MALSPHRSPPPPPPLYETHVVARSQDHSSPQRDALSQEVPQLPLCGPLGTFSRDYRSRSVLLQQHPELFIDHASSIGTPINHHTPPIITQQQHLLVAPMSPTRRAVPAYDYYGASASAGVGLGAGIPYSAAAVGTSIIAAAGGVDNSSPRRVYVAANEDQGYGIVSQALAESTGFYPTSTATQQQQQHSFTQQPYYTSGSSSVVVPQDHYHHQHQLQTSDYYYNSNTNYHPQTTSYALVQQQQQQQQQQYQQSSPQPQYAAVAAAPREYYSDHAYETTQRATTQQYRPPPTETLNGGGAGASAGWSQQTYQQQTQPGQQRPVAVVRT